MEVTGPLQVRLFAATSVCDTDFTAKLVHVYPDGGAYNLAEGLLRASGRELGDERKFVVPGEVNQYVITLGNTSQVFRKGSRIRLDITSSNFPQFDRNMNTGHVIGEDAQGVPAIQTILHSSEFASYIDLPVIPVG
jgi:putative CocE/NonD family hydrolase